MDNLQPALLERGGVCSGITRRGKYNFHPLLHDNLDVICNLWVEKREINSEWLIGSGLGLANLVAKYIGIHGAGTQKTEATGITDS